MHQSGAEDEFDLVSGWVVVVRWKYVVLGAFLIGLAGGIGFQFLMTPPAESSIVIQVGRVGGLGRIQSATELVQRLTQAHRLFERSRPLPHITSVREVGEDALLLAAAGRTRESSRAFLMSEVDKIIRDHGAIFEDVVGQKTRTKESLLARKAVFEERARAFGERAKSLTQGNAAIGAVMMHDEARIDSEVAVLEQRVQTIELELSPIVTWPTRVVRELAFADAWRLRNRMFFVLGGAAGGLLVGLAAALVLDALFRHRAHLR